MTNEFIIETHNSFEQPVGIKVRPEVPCAPTNYIDVTTIFGRRFWFYHHLPHSNIGSISLGVACLSCLGEGRRGLMRLQLELAGSYWQVLLAGLVAI